METPAPPIDTAGPERPNTQGTVPGALAEGEPTQEGPETAPTDDPSPEAQTSLAGPENAVEPRPTGTESRRQQKRAFLRQLGTAALEYADRGNSANVSLPPARTARQRHQLDMVARRAEALRAAQEERARIKKSDTFLAAVGHKTKVTRSWKRSEERHLEQELRQDGIGVAEYRHRTTHLEEMKTGGVHEHTRELAEGEALPLPKTKHIKRLEKGIRKQRHPLERLARTGQRHSWQVEAEPIPGAPTVLLVGGATEGKATQWGLTEAMRKEQLDAYAFDYTTEKAPVDESVEGQRRYQEAKIAQAIEEIDRLADDKKITLFAHSLGAPIAAFAALARPDKVERVVMSSPAGLADDTFPRLAGRFVAETFLRKTNTPTKLGRRQTWQGIKNIATHPLAFLGDAKDASRTPLPEILAELEKQGVEVHITGGNAEAVYPIKRIMKNLVDRSPKTPGGAVDSLPVSGVSSYYATRPKRGSKDMPPEWLNRAANTDQEKEELRQAMEGVKVGTHKLAGEYAGHDQSIIYPRYVAKLVKQLIEK